jgi:hypothetical protein
MLLNVPYKTGDVVSMKLVTGEEVVGKLDDDGTDSVTIHRPLVLAAGPQGMSLAPYMITANDAGLVTYKRTHVVAMAASAKQMSDNYLQATTGIALS